MFSKTEHIYKGFYPQISAENFVFSSDEGELLESLAGNILEKQIFEQEIELIQDKILAITSDIKITEQEISLLNKDIEDFLEYYFVEMAGQINFFEEENNKKNNIEVKEEISSNELDINIDNIFHASYSEQAKRDVLKKTYRFLQKKFHPDLFASNNSDSCTEVTISLINKLYHEKNIAGLNKYLTIEEYCTIHEVDSEIETIKTKNYDNKLLTKIEDLEKLFIKKQAILLQIIQKREEIYQSREYKILSFYKLCQIRNEDFMSKIKKLRKMF